MPKRENTEEERPVKRYKESTDPYDYWDVFTTQLELCFVSFGWRDKKRRINNEEIPIETIRGLFRVFHRIGTFLFFQLKTKQDLKKLGVKIFGDEYLEYYNDLSGAKNVIQVVDLDNEFFSEGAFCISEAKYEEIKDLKKVVLDGMDSHEYSSNGTGHFSELEGYTKVGEDSVSSDEDLVSSDEDSVSSDKDSMSSDDVSPQPSESE